MTKEFKAVCEKPSIKKIINEIEYENVPIKKEDKRSMLKIGKPVNKGTFRLSSFHCLFNQTTSYI